VSALGAATRNQVTTMINLIGKTLVILNAALSVIFLTFALGVFTNRIDWGWKEPRLELGLRVPSEIDKRTAAVKLFLRHREMVEKAVDAAQKELAADELNWAAYHLEYASLLDMVRSGKGDLDIKAIKMDRKKGELIFDPTQPGKAQVDGPVFYEPKIGPKVQVKNSFEALDQVLQGIQKQLDDMAKEVGIEADKMTKMAELIDGKYNPTKDKKIRPGIYDLLEQQKDVHKQLKREMEELEPLWVRKLVEAQLLVTRKQELEARLKELKAKLASVDKK
jgi:hypothetical protein